MSRPSRPPRGGGAYVPPHLRGRSSSTTAEGRTLDELAQHSMHITVEFTPGGPFSFEGCPDNILEQTGQQQQQQPQEEQRLTADQAPHDKPLTCRLLDSPACPDDYQIRELLLWFKQACNTPQQADFPNGDTSAVLSLPACLSKRERAIWHHTAQNLGLESASTCDNATSIVQGIGDARFLQIRPRPPQPSDESSWRAAPPGSTAAAAARVHNQPGSSSTTPKTNSPPLPTAAAAADGASNASSSSSSRNSSRNSSSPTNSNSRDTPNQGQGRQYAKQGDRRQQLLQQQIGRFTVKQVWHWCQLEGGALEKYSQGEVQELLQAGEARYPPEFAAVIRTREAAAALVAALQKKDAVAALALLKNSHPQDRLAWVRDIQSGGYPAHIAAWHGLGEVVRQLVANHGVEILQQRDASRDTPVTLAQKQGHKHFAEQLEQLRLEGISSSSNCSDRPDSNNITSNGGRALAGTSGSSETEGFFHPQIGSSTNTAGADREFQTPSGMIEDKVAHQ